MTEQLLECEHESDVDTSENMQTMHVGQDRQQSAMHPDRQQSQDPTTRAIKWYLVYTVNKGIDKFRRNLQIYDLEHTLVEIYEPKKKIKCSATQKVKYENLYPGFAFVGFDIDSIDEVKDITPFLKKEHGKPVEIPLVQVERARQTEAKFDQAPEVDIAIKVGDAVSIKQGKYEGWKGRVTKIDSESYIVTIVMEILGTEMYEDLPLDDLEHDAIDTID